MYGIVIMLFTALHEHTVCKCPSYEYSSEWVNFILRIDSSLNTYPYFLSLPVLLPYIQSCLLCCLLPCFLSVSCPVSCPVSCLSLPGLLASIQPYLLRCLLPIFLPCLLPCLLLVPAWVRNLRRFFVPLPRVYTSFTWGISVVAHFPYLEQICNSLV